MVKLSCGRLAGSVSSFTKQGSQTLTGFLLFFDGLVAGIARSLALGQLEPITEIGPLLIAHLIADRFPAIPVGSRGEMPAIAADPDIAPATRTLAAPYHRDTRQFLAAMIAIGHGA